MRVHCPVCKAEYQVPDAAVASVSRARCGQCGELFSLCASPPVVHHATPVAVTAEIPPPPPPEPVEVDLGPEPRDIRRLVASIPSSRLHPSGNYELPRTSRDNRGPRSKGSGWEPPPPPPFRPSGPSRAPTRRPAEASPELVGFESQSRPPLERVRAVLARGSDMDDTGPAFAGGRDNNERDDWRQQGNGLGRRSQAIILPRLIPRPVAEGGLEPIGSPSRISRRALWGAGIAATTALLAGALISGRETVRLISPEAVRIYSNLHIGGNTLSQLSGNTTFAAACGNGKGATSAADCKQGGSAPGLK